MSRSKAIVALRRWVSQGYRPSLLLVLARPTSASQARCARTAILWRRGVRTSAPGLTQSLRGLGKAKNEAEAIRNECEWTGHRKLKQSFTHPLATPAGEDNNVRTILDVERWRVVFDHDELRPDRVL
jgi:hypothetical protein